MTVLFAVLTIAWLGCVLFLWEKDAPFWEILMGIWLSVACGWALVNESDAWQKATVLVMSAAGAVTVVVRHRHSLQDE